MQDLNEDDESGLVPFESVPLGEWAMFSDKSAYLIRTKPFMLHGRLRLGYRVTLDKKEAFPATLEPDYPVMYPIH